MGCGQETGRGSYSTYSERKREGETAAAQQEAVRNSLIYTGVPIRTHVT